MSSLWRLGEENRAGRPLYLLLRSLSAEKVRETSERRKRIQTEKTMKKGELHLSTRAIHSEVDK